jgi:hypothetical protein
VCPFKADHDFILCTLGNKGELSQNLPRNATEPTKIEVAPEIQEQPKQPDKKENGKNEQLDLFDF